MRQLPKDLSHHYRASARSIAPLRCNPEVKRDAANYRMPLDPLTEVMKYYAVGSRQVGQQSRQVVKHDLPQWQAGCRNIGVMIVLGIDMNEHVGMLAQHGGTRRLGNPVTFGNNDPRIDALHAYRPASGAPCAGYPVHADHAPRPLPAGSPGPPPPAPRRARYRSVPRARPRPAQHPCAGS